MKNNKKIKTIKNNVVSKTCIGRINFSLVKVRRKN